MANKIKDAGLLKKDLYQILQVDENATDKQILTGYRKKALKCHPDKNPDNPKAAEEFHELCLALEILTDAAARAAYDNSRKAKREVEARNKVLDSKRKKFKEDLEARERAAETNVQRFSEIDAEKKLLLEIERLREEGSRLLQEEQSRLREQLKSFKDTDGVDQSKDIPRMKLKWKATKGDVCNGGYNEQILTDLFSCYGKVNTLLISSKRNGSAIVEFETSGVSSDVLGETGLADNPLSITWLSGKPSQVLGSGCSFDFCGTDNVNFANGNSFDAMNSGASSVNFTSTSMVDCNSSSSGSVPSKPVFGCGDSSLNDSGSAGQGFSSDFESLVLRKMRQAEERKRLIEQMQNEDD